MLQYVVEVPKDKCTVQQTQRCWNVTRLVPAMNLEEECTDMPRETCTWSFANKTLVKRPVLKRVCPEEPVFNPGLVIPTHDINDIDDNEEATTLIAPSVDDSITLPQTGTPPIIPPEGAERPEHKGKDDNFLRQSCGDMSDTDHAGVFTIKLESGNKVQVYCTKDKWTVFQSRGNFGNPKDFFNRTWAEYKAGFGEPGKEHWLGLDNLHELCKLKKYCKLKIVLTLPNWSQKIFEFPIFTLNGPQVLY